MNGPTGVETNGIEAGETGTVPPPVDTTAETGFTPPVDAKPSEETVDAAGAGLDTAEAGLDALPERICDGKGRFTPEANAALDEGQAALATAREADPGLDGPLAGKAAGLETKMEAVRARGRDQVHDDLHLADTIGEVDTNWIGKGATFATDRFVDFANGAAAVAVRSGHDLGDVGAGAFTAVFGAPGKVDESLLARGAGGVEDGVRSLMTRPGETIIGWRAGAVEAGRDLRAGVGHFGANLQVGLNALTNDPGATAEAIGTAFGNHAKQAYREHGALGAAGVLMTEAGLVVADARDVVDVARGLRSIARSSDDALALADDLDALGQGALGRANGGSRDVAALERVEAHLDDPEIAGLLDEAKRAGEAQPRRPIAGAVAMLDETAPLSLHMGDGVHVRLSPRTLDEILPPDAPVDVRRSSGDVETWQVLGVADGTVTVGKEVDGQTLTKRYDGGTLDRLLDVNPDLRMRLIPSARAEEVMGALAVGDTATVGRQSNMDVSVPGQPTVSREHASVTRLPNTADGRAVHMVGDARSTNGTLVRTAEGVIELPRGGTVMVEGQVSVIVGRVGTPDDPSRYDPGLVMSLGDAPSARRAGTPRADTPGTPEAPGAPNAPGGVRQVYDPQNLRIAPSDVPMRPEIAAASFENVEARGGASLASGRVMTTGGFHQYVTHTYDERLLTGFKARLSVAPEDTARAWDIVLDVAEENDITFKVARRETLARWVEVDAFGQPHKQDGKTFTLYDSLPRTPGSDGTADIQASGERWRKALQEISDRFEANGIAPHRFADPSLAAPKQDIPIEGGFEGIAYVFDKKVGSAWRDKFGPSNYIKANQGELRPEKPGGPFESLQLQSWPRQGQ